MVSTWHEPIPDLTYENIRGRQSKVCRAISVQEVHAFSNLQCYLVLLSRGQSYFVLVDHVMQIYITDIRTDPYTETILLLLSTILHELGDDSQRLF